jgi:hypothetical protein
MIYISHRGNIDGKKPHLENQPEYIDTALQLGYDVEVDVWFADGKFMLGHDEPLYETDYKFLMNENLWVHAKNLDALIELKKYAIHYFWHEEDTVALTSKNYIWAYPGKQPIKGSIAVMPERSDDDISVCKGICSDVIKKYKDEITQA